MQDEKNEDQEYQKEVCRLVSLLERGQLEGCNNLQKLVEFIEEGNRASVQQWFEDNGLPYLHAYRGINRLVKDYRAG